MRKLSLGSINTYTAFTQAMQLFDKQVPNKEYKISFIEIDLAWLQQLLNHHADRISSISFLIQPSDEVKQLLAESAIPFIIKFDFAALKDVEDNEVFSHLQEYSKNLSNYDPPAPALLSFLLKAKSLRHRNFNGSIVNLNYFTGDSYALSQPLLKIYNGEAPRTQFLLKLSDRDHWFAMDAMFLNNKLSLIVIEPAHDPGFLIELFYLKHFLNLKKIPHYIYVIPPMLQSDSFNCGFFSYMILSETAKLTHQQLIRRLAWFIPAFLLESAAYKSSRIQNLCRNVVWLCPSNLPEKCFHFTQSYKLMKLHLRFKGYKEQEADDICLKIKSKWGEKNEYLKKRMVKHSAELNNPALVTGLFKFRINNYTRANILFKAYHDYGRLTPELIKKFCAPLPVEKQIKVILDAGDFLLNVPNKLIPKELNLARSIGKLVENNFAQYLGQLDSLLALRTVLLEIVQKERYCLFEDYPLLNPCLFDHHNSSDSRYTNFQIAIMVASHGGINEEYLEELRFREKLHKAYPLPYLQLLYKTEVGFIANHEAPLSIAFAMSYLTPTEVDKLLSLYTPQIIPNALESMILAIKLKLEDVFEFLPSTAEYSSEEELWDDDDSVVCGAVFSKK